MSSTLKHFKFRRLRLAALPAGGIFFAVGGAVTPLSGCSLVFGTCIREAPARHAGAAKEIKNKR
jgi:hypothetical protein